MSELDRLHYQLLFAIHRHGTIGNAASALHMSQSAASQRLLQAQRRLGIELTTKHGRTISLTPAALCLVQAARHSERLLRAAETEALWLDHRAAPTLTMAVDVHDALWWLPPLLAELDPADGIARLETVRCAPDEGPRFVAEGRADVHLTPNTTSDPTARTVRDDRLVGVVGATNPLATRKTLTPSDFHGCDYATYSTTPRDGFEHETFLAPYGAIPATITRFESVTTILAVIGSSSRITILPEWAVPAHPSAVIRPLQPAPPTITWNLLSRDLDPAGPLHRTREHLVQHLANTHPAAPSENYRPFPELPVVLPPHL